MLPRSTPGSDLLRSQGRCSSRGGARGGSCHGRPSPTTPEIAGVVSPFSPPACYLAICDLLPAMGVGHPRDSRSGVAILLTCGPPIYFGFNPRDERWGPPR